MAVLQVLMYTLHFCVSLALILLVVSQTSRHEGLGSMGGGASSNQSFRGRAGLDEKLQQYTRYAAIAFMALSAVLYIMAERFGWS